MDNPPCIDDFPIKASIFCGEFQNRHVSLMKKYEKIMKPDVQKKIRTSNAIILLFGIVISALAVFMIYLLIN